MTADTRARSISEAELQKAIIELAQHLGYLVSHQRPARTEKGWRTAISGDPGFPDLVLVREDRIVFCELKSHRGRVSAQQKVWHQRLTKVSHKVSIVSRGSMTVAPVQFHLWRPEDWTSGLIEGVLR